MGGMQEGELGRPARAFVKVVAMTLVGAVGKTIDVVLPGGEARV